MDRGHKPQQQFKCLKCEKNWIQPVNNVLFFYKWKDILAWFCWMGV